MGDRHVPVYIDVLYATSHSKVVVSCHGCCVNASSAPIYMQATWFKWSTEAKRSGEGRMRAKQKLAKLGRILADRPKREAGLVAFATLQTTRNFLALANTVAKHDSQDWL